MEEAMLLTAQTSFPSMGQSENKLDGCFYVDNFIKESREEKRKYEQGERETLSAKVKYEIPWFLQHPFHRSTVD